MFALVLPAFLHLIDHLAIQTECCCRPCFQAPKTDFHTTGLTESITLGTLGFKSQNGFIDFSDQPPFSITVPQLNRHVSLLTRTVGRIRMIDWFHPAM